MFLENIDPIALHLVDDTKVVASKQVTVWLDFNSYIKHLKRKTRLAFKKILFIPETVVSMLSCEQLNIMDTSIVFSKDRCLFSETLNCGRTLGQAEGKYSDGLYVLEEPVKSSNRSSLLTSRLYTMRGQGADLWHKRLGNSGKDVIQMMPKGYAKRIKWKKQS